jgi:tRNA C32,U32 (ribose-2'-O)-methylase TrmJ
MYQGKGSHEQVHAQVRIYRNLQQHLKNVEYLYATSIHTIRRQLGKKVDERYAEVQRSQHLTQGDPCLFG